MRIKNPIRTYMEKKEEEKRRKKEEARKRKKRLIFACTGVFAFFVIITGIGAWGEDNAGSMTEKPAQTEVAEKSEALKKINPAVDLGSIPAYSGSPFTVINDNIPYFTEADLNTTSFETYSPLDRLGRCGAAYANIGRDLMPTGKRGSIGEVIPSGWHLVKYDCVDGKYLYNRCHLIAYQLTAENANKQNLITGTRYMNAEGMLPFENMVADYIKETGNHVLYRVTPVFEGDNMVANGVLMEAKSVEDKGEGILFNVYCYNVQPKIIINYATGDSTLESDHKADADKSASSEHPVVSPQTSGQQDKSEAMPAQTSESTAEAVPTEDVSGGTSAQAVAAEQTPAGEAPAAEQNVTVESENPVGYTYILNTNTKKFHNPACPSVKRMKDSNKEEYTGNRDDVISRGYAPCKNCNP